MKDLINFSNEQLVNELEKRRKLHLKEKNAFKALPEWKKLKISYHETFGKEHSELITSSFQFHFEWNGERRWDIELHEANFEMARAKLKKKYKAKVDKLFNSINAFAKQQKIDVFDLTESFYD